MDVSLRRCQRLFSQLKGTAPGTLSCTVDLRMHVCVSDRQSCCDEFFFLQVYVTYSGFGLKKKTQHNTLVVAHRFISLFSHLRVPDG